MTAHKKPNEPRKHHYVPVYYQRNFVNESGLLWVYDRRRRTYKELHPLSICFEKDLYTVKHADKPADPQLETKVLRLIDNLGSCGVRDFINKKVDSLSEYYVALSMAYQWTRVPTFSRDTRDTYAKSIEELARISFANVERARKIMEKIEKEKGKPMEVTPESMVKAVQDKEIKIEATEIAFFHQMTKQAQSLSKLLIALDWLLLVATKNTNFIICDCPVVVVPPKGDQRVGFAVPGATKYYPLSRNLCLCLGESGGRRGVRHVDPQVVRTINMNIAANSERFIMAASRQQLEHIVRRSACTDAESIARFTLVTVESDDNSALQMLRAQPRRYFYGKEGS